MGHLRPRARVEHGHGQRVEIGRLEVPFQGPVEGPDDDRLGAGLDPDDLPAVVVGDLPAVVDERVVQEYGSTGVDLLDASDVDGVDDPAAHVHGTPLGALNPAQPAAIPQVLPVVLRHAEVLRGPAAHRQRRGRLVRVVVPLVVQEHIGVPAGSRDRRRTGVQRRELVAVGEVVDPPADDGHGVGQLHGRCRPAICVSRATRPVPVLRTTTRLSSSEGLVLVVEPPGVMSNA